MLYASCHVESTSTNATYDAGVTISNWYQSLTVHSTRFQPRIMVGTEISTSRDTLGYNQVYQLRRATCYVSY